LAEAEGVETLGPDVGTLPDSQVKRLLIYFYGRASLSDVQILKQESAKGLSK